MDDHTLAKLQFDHVAQALAGHCACSLGRRLAAAIRPSTSLSEIQHWLQQVREMQAAQAVCGLTPLGGVTDIRAHLENSARPAGLEPEALSEVAVTLGATTAVRAWLGRLPEDLVRLRGFAGRVGDFTEIVRAIDDAVDSRAQVRDEASPRLGAIRRAIESTRKQIDVVIDRILRQKRYTRYLQYPNATFHNDRVVLPLKAEHRGRIPGIVHRSSDSGATVFVEPSQAVELNNGIAQLRTKEHEEVSRILSALSRLVYRQAAEIQRTLDALSVLDLIGAKVRYAAQRRAICPQMTSGRVLDLHGARHPVLVDLFEQARAAGGQAGQVVPIDLRLGDDFDVLVITGPNTGGKTVTLKTVGLLAAMAQAEIPIPADEGTTLPVYSRIDIDVGDEQSIEQSLSTFSSHLSNILAMLKAADQRSLVLMDELGAGTDPDEGAAIGRAVLDELLARRCSAVVTTHLSQLKAVAYVLERVDNASVEFDVATLRPTYVVRMGEPGNSNAIAIAQRLGMPQHMVDRARGHLDDQHRALARAIEGTLASRRQAEAARKAAAQAQLAAQRSEAEFQARARELEQTRAAHEAWTQWINTLRTGDTVYVKSFQKPARVVRMQLHKQSAVVSTGKMELEVGISQLSQPEGTNVKC